MAYRRTPRGRGISQSQRRKKAWIAVKSVIGGAGGNALFMTSNQLPLPASAAGVGATSTLLLGLVTDPSTTVGDETSTLPEESTILRARGSLLFPKTEFTPGNNFPIAQFAFGFGVTDIRSIVNGVAPGPILDADWDGWMFLRQSAVAPVDSEGTVIDVKAMRKLKTGDALFFSAQGIAGTAAATSAVDFIFDLRLLMLLP